MELDVHLTRETEEPWGFEIVEDIGIPLTIDKVYPSSPAASAGLQPGDMITRIGDKLTTELTLDAALDIISEAIGSLSMGVTRGLYEPVLDDFEPIYEPIEPVDFDRQSATEVYLPDYGPRASSSPSELNDRSLSKSQTPYDFSAQLSTSQTPQELSAQLRATSQTPYDFSDQLLPNSQIPNDYSAQLLSNSQTSQEFSAIFGSRSVTASPFATNKIYRPFSTEPLEVPSLEDPIILNPDYKDDFSFIDEATGEEIIKTKFKLPISEQYDPNYSKKVAEILDNIGKEKTIEKDVKINVKNNINQQQQTQININNLESNKTEEKTIETQEFNTNIDIAEVKSENITTTETKDIHEETKITEHTELNIESIEQTAVNIVDESIERAVSVTREIQHEIEEELRASATREIDTSVKASKVTEEQELKSVTEDSVHIKTEFTEAKQATSQEIVTKNIAKTYDSKDISQSKESNINKNVTLINERANTEMTNAENLKRDSVKHEYTLKEDRKVTSSEFDDKSEINYSESGKENKHMAFEIGLKTIPNIRGMVQSSHHFDLLLRTFFIHLTDVMVALSRFILTQPAIKLNNTSEKIMKDQLVTDYGVNKTSKEKTINEERVTVKREFASDKILRTAQESKSVNKTQASEVKKETKAQNEITQKNEVTETQIDKKKQTGAKIAQKQQMKSKELTQKMDAVITEFETKSGIEETERRRSRSRIEEEVMIECDPLEWLEKFDRSSQERTEVTETKDIKATHKKTGKQMYVATVESHVYTNKDTIFEENVSETSSVQSSEEVALEVIGSFNENVAVKSSIATSDKHQAVQVITDALEDIVQEKQQTLESVTQYDTKIDEKSSKILIEDSQVIASAQIIQSNTELKHEELDTEETKTQQAVITSKESSKTAVQNTSLSLESTKEFTESNSITQQAFVKQEFLGTAVSESIETSSVDSVKVFKSNSIKEGQATVISATDFKETVLESMEIPLEATTEVVHQKTDAKEAKHKQELLTNIASEVTEAVNLETTTKTETFEAVNKTATVSSETNYKSSVSQSETVIQESNAEIKVVKIKEETALSRIEPLSIAVAETINTAIDEKVDTFETESLDSKQATIRTEESYKSVATESTEVALEASEDQHAIKLEAEAQVKEDTTHFAVAGIVETKTETDKVKEKTYEEEHAALKIVKEEVINIDNSSEIVQSEINIHKSLQTTQIECNEEISKEQFINSEKTESVVTLQSHKGVTQNSKSKLRLQTEFTANGDLINTPTPSTVPPTPLTDEYVFKLSIPLPKSRGPTPIPEEVDHEDPHIVKKKLVPHIEAKIEDQIIYDPPLQSPVAEKSEPVYTKPGLRGGGYVPCSRKEYIREIERKSSLLASAIDETIKSIEVYKEEVGLDTQKEEVREEEETEEVKEVIGEELVGYRQVSFNPEVGKDKKNAQVTFQVNLEGGGQNKVYTDASGERLGTVQGIVDGLEDATVDDQAAKELGKPGLTEEKIAELISGESEMLREAHVMGLSRVISSHMHRPDDSVDFNKIKPLVESLKDSEVLKALNEELLKTQAEKKKKDDKKWTTFLQKPKRPVPKPKFGYHGYIEAESSDNEEPYKVKIVKQPKPKVAPDYKPEDFDTGPLPWEERALNEPSPPPIEPEDPILIPEGTPEFLEAVDPLPESEVPDLEDTGIPLPPPRQLATPEEPKEEEEQLPEPEAEVEVAEVTPEEPPAEDMADKAEVNANSLIEGIKNMVDPSAPIEQQLNQMRAQLAALAQLPSLIQQSLEMLTRQLMMGQQDSQVQQRKTECESTEETVEHHEESVTNENTETQVVEYQGVHIEEMLPAIEEAKEEPSPQPCEDEQIVLVKNEQETLAEIQDEKQKKAIEEQMRLEQESRQLKQRPTPRVGKPKPVFGPLHPEERPLVLPGGRKWRGPRDVMNDQMIAETLQGQAEIIQGKVMGINFMKYEKPPVSLDHLKHSEVYKVVHNMDNAPLKRVELLTPVVAEADYRERCRSTTPSVQSGPKQLQP